ncbi:diguanylate cyclase [Salinimonas marina]|uniref:diguanylate cyclase n=1 Tax=Salinimonas marina TaxID=2785918 RepID=A0A7S9DYS8_9ALTE|nr:response regulator [Salinimonas marina]QPG05800.1 diguanylate cyclase [Salinimonas marina]
MQSKVLVIEDSKMAMNIVIKLVEKAGLEAVTAQSLTEARYVFSQAMPESFLCAIVDYNLPDAVNGQAIDFCLESILPTIVVTGRMDATTRNSVLSREVVDYIPKENAQTYDYLSRLLGRLERNKHIGIVVTGQDRRSARHMVSLLKRHNFNTYEASTAAQTQQLLRENHNIKVVITGAELEDQNSTALIANLRADYTKEQLAIISVCERGNDMHSARYIKSGANDFLLKPYCHEEFLCRISQNIELIEHVEALTSMAHTDFLTGLVNRRYFFDKLSAMVPDSDRAHALAMLDLDFFKAINDTYGHDAGDEVLIRVAGILKQQFDDGVVARFGGEEFVVFLPSTPPKLAFKRLETFRRDVEALNFTHAGQTYQVSTSVGLLTVLPEALNVAVSQADELLYQAKKAGRNRIVSDIAAARQRIQSAV